MSEETTTEAEVPQEAPSASEVADAFDAAVEEVPSSAAPSEETSPIKPSVKKKSAKPSAVKVQKVSTESVDTLVHTVDSLAGTVSTLTGMVDSLGQRAQSNSDRIVESWESFRQSIAAAAAPGSPLAEVVDPPVEADEPAKPSEASLLARAGTGYLSLLATFIGVGLVASAVTASPFGVANLIVAAAGCVLSVGAWLFDTRSESRGGIRGLALGVGASVLVVLGVGMLVGGIQHFSDVPDRAAKLIPIGAALAAVGFLARSKFRLALEHLIWVAGAAVWVCLFLTVGLGKLASSYDEPAKTPAPETPAATADASHGAQPVAATDASHDTQPADAKSAEHGSESASADSHGETTTSTTVDTHGESMAATPSKAASSH